MVVCATLDLAYGVLVPVDTHLNGIQQKVNVNVGTLCVSVCLCT